MAPYFKSNLLCQSSHAREVCFPGGKCDSHEETDVDAALRETFEELGIPPDKINVWTHMQPIANHKGMTCSTLLTIVVSIGGFPSFYVIFAPLMNA